MPLYSLSVRVAPLALLTLVALAGFGADEPAPPNVIATLKGHAEAVYSITFSPDDKYVVTGSFDHTLKLWDAATGKERKTFSGPNGHKNQVLSVAINSEGTLLASGSSDNSVKIWDFPTDKYLRNYPQSEPVKVVAVSPDGTRLALGLQNGTAKVMTLADGKDLFTVTGHNGPVKAIGFSSNNSVIVTGGTDRTLRFWNAADGKPLGSFVAQTGGLTGLAIAPNNGSVFSTSADGTPKFWSLPTVAARTLTTAHKDTVNALSLGGDNTTLASASADKTVRLSNLTNGQAIRTLEGAKAAVLSTAVSSNNALVVAGTADHQLLVWNVADGKLLGQKLAHKGPVNGVAINSAGNQILSVGGDGSLKIWSMPASAARTTDMAASATHDAHTGGANAVAYHSNGTQAITGGADKAVKLWDLTTGKVLRAFGPLKDAVIAVALSRDATQISAAAGKSVTIWTTADAKEVRTLAHPADVTSLSFNGDKTRLATTASDGLTRVWDLATGLELQAFAQNEAAKAVIFHPSNTTVVSAGAEKSIVVNTLTLTRSINTGTPVRALAVTPNGSHLLTGGDDKKVKFWNTSSGMAESKTLEGDKSVSAIAVSKNNLLVAVGYGDLPTRIYNLSDGKMLTSLKTAGTINGLAFNSTNTALVTTSKDGPIQVWNMTYNSGQPIGADFGKEIHSYRAPGSVSDMVFSPNSQILFTASEKAIESWKLPSEAPLFSLGHPNLVDAVAFQPKGTLMATGCHDGKLRLYDSIKGSVIKDVVVNTPVPNQGPSAIYSLAWSPDGKQVLVGSQDGSMKLYDVPALTLVREFKAYKAKDFEKGHRDSVFTVAISPDGKTIASGGSDRSIKLWNLANATVVRELTNPALKAGPSDPPPAHPGWIYGIRFAPDGKQLVSAGGAPRRAARSLCGM